LLQKLFKVSRGGKDPSLSSLFYLTSFVSALLEESVEKMAGESTSVRSMNPHPRIDVVKFNDTNIFGMWRCKVMDALIALNLKNTLRLEKKRASTTKED